MSYLTPSSSAALPGGLTLTQFIQTVLVGLSGIDGTLVRPQWQAEPPKMPDINTDWLSFGVRETGPDANGYLWTNDAEETVYKRHAQLEVICSFYGPAASENAAIVRDGFQIPDNLVALRSANMGFTGTSPEQRVPEPINGRFFNRVDVAIALRREIQRIYPIVTLLSASGTVHTVTGDEEYLLGWDTDDRRPE